MPGSGTDEVLRGFSRWLDERRPGTTHSIVAHTVPSVGYSGETILVEVARSGIDTSSEHLALKLEPAGPAIFPDYDFACQAHVQNVVASHGIPAPAPAVAENDRQWLGRPFLVMPAVSGYIVSEIPVGDAWLTGGSAELARTAQCSYMDTLADITRLDWRSEGLAEVVPVRDNGAELAHWRSYLDWYGVGEVLVPALVEALDWCEANRPIAEPDPSLLWGDVRLGNLIFDDDRSPVAVIDWEMASIGSAEHDLAWTLMHQTTQDQLFAKTVPGFLGRDELVARYEQRIARPVQDLEWYEVFAMTRSCALFARISHLNEAAGLPVVLPIADNAMLDILQRRIDDFSSVSRSH